MLPMLRTVQNEVLLAAGAYTKLLARREACTALNASAHTALAQLYLHIQLACAENRLGRADAARLRALVDALPARERAIMRQRYGFDGAPKTQQQTAQALHISRSYVSRLEKRALEYLRGQWPAE